MKQFFLIASLMILFVACNDQKPADVAKMVRETKASIFTTVQTKHIAGFDIRYTTDTVHNELGVVVKVFSHVDTIPQMAMTKDTLGTGRTYRDSNDNEVEKDTIIIHPKDYQMYISVKN